MLAVIAADSIVRLEEAIFILRQRLSKAKTPVLSEQVAILWVPFAIIVIAES